jgi:hypothetical protein
LAVHIPSAKAGGLREQLDIVDFADRLRIGLETEPRIVEISKCEPLPLGNRAGRRMRKRRRLRSGTRNGFRPQNTRPRPTPSKLFQSSATQWVPSRAYFWRDDLCVIRDHRVAVPTAGRDRARPSRSARLTYPVLFQSRRFITTPCGANPKPGRSRTAMPP